MSAGLSEKTATECAEEKVVERLQQCGLITIATHQMRLTIRTFLDASKPVSVKDMLFSVKRFDPLVSKHTVLKALKTLAECGLANAIPPERNRQPVKYALVPDGERKNGNGIACSHRNLICKDCGTPISDLTIGLKSFRA